MRNENMVILVGNLTKDPELRTAVVNGREVSVVKFRLAVSDEYTTSSGNSNKITTYLNCEAWDSAATLIADTLVKGDPIFVKGSLRSDSWEKDGVKHNSIKVRVSTFSPLSRRSKGMPVSVAVESEDGEKTPF